MFIGEQGRGSNGSRVSNTSRVFY